MKFWDSSAVVPLLHQESRSAAMRELLARDPKMVVWWATEIECASALARLGREKDANPRGTIESFERLLRMAARWNAVEPSPEVKRTAIRLVRVHPLRAADAMQLAAAIVGSGGGNGPLELVTLDGRLATAARKEGLVVVGEESP